jgi:hypothetical protein
LLLLHNMLSTIKTVWIKTWAAKYLGTNC